MTGGSATRGMSENGREGSWHRYVLLLRLVLEFGTRTRLRHREEGLAVDRRRFVLNDEFRLGRPRLARLSGVQQAEAVELSPACSWTPPAAQDAAPPSAGRTLRRPARTRRGGRVRQHGVRVLATRPRAAAVHRRAVPGHARSSPTSRGVRSGPHVGCAPAGSARAGRGGTLLVDEPTVVWLTRRGLAAVVCRGRRCGRATRLSSGRARSSFGSPPRAVSAGGVGVAARIGELPRDSPPTSRRHPQPRRGDRRRRRRSGRARPPPAETPRRRLIWQHDHTLLVMATVSERAREWIDEQGGRVSAISFQRGPRASRYPGCRRSRRSSQTPGLAGRRRPAGGPVWRFPHTAADRRRRRGGCRTAVTAMERDVNPDAIHSTEPVPALPLKHPDSRALPFPSPAARIPDHLPSACSESEGRWSGTTGASEDVCERERGHARNRDESAVNRERPGELSGKERAVCRACCRRGV